MVADGMGGYSSGDVASQSIVNSLADLPGAETLAEVVDTIEEWVIEVNDYLISLAKGRPEGTPMGSTIVGLVARGDRLVILWAGDSRIYRYRNGVLEQMSEDHSLVQEMVNRGELEADKAESHPAANVISRAIGVTEELFIDMDALEAEQGDTYLLCSDGLYKELRDQDISDHLSRCFGLQECATRLVDSAVAAGGRDNITVVMVSF